MNRRAVVVIPVHSPEPTEYELISFNQCFKILNKYRIVVLAPAHLDLGAYRNVQDFEALAIDPNWQSTLLNYNRLKLSRYFYNLFRAHEYLLTYELDAFVFRDELDYWCNSGYDYVGAPWMEGFTNSTSTKFLGVGNSGFSLRSIPAIINALEKFNYKDPIEFTKPEKKPLIKYFKDELRVIYHKPFRSYFTHSCGSISLYEDYIISQVIAKKIKEFSIAPVSEAIKFSHEVRPDFLYKLNGNRLPMGCHAWWKYNFEFWKPFIQSYGYTL